MTDQKITDLECTIEQIAALAGVSPRHCRRLLSDTPQLRRGRWKLGPAVAAIVEGLAGGSGGESLTAERTRLVKWQADRAEMEFLVAKGELAPISQMQRGWEKRCALIRARMLNIPRRTVTMLIGETDERRYKAILTDEIKNALTDAADEELSPEDIEDDTTDENDDT